LGWLILREPVTLWTVAGGLLVIIGVMGIFQSNKTRVEPEGSSYEESIDPIKSS